MRSIHVLRKPVCAPHVAANVLAHGCGALNINAARVAIKEGDGKAFRKGTYADQRNLTLTSTNLFGATAVGSAYRKDQPEGGRWPGNLVLQHLAGCTPQADAWHCEDACPAGVLKDATESLLQGGASKFFLQVRSDFG